MEVHSRMAEPWRVTLVDTGDSTLTGGRLRRVREHIGDETFCFTYGDGLSDVDVRGAVDFHHSHGKLATITAVQPPGRYGALQIESGRVNDFHEKPHGDGAWINGGFFVLEPDVKDFILQDMEPFETGALPKLVTDSNLSAYHHEDFWQPMDTLREKQELAKMAVSGKPAWLNGL
jgi:glucose-1-phosphate cytidylyltransferase